jgi:hypothetical protein
VQEEISATRNEFIMEKVDEIFEGSKLDGNPETTTSTTPPRDCIVDGFTDTTAATESSITE